MRKSWLIAVALIACTPAVAQRGFQSLRHMDDHFDYWDRCSSNHYELERRIAYCKSILADGRHSQAEVLTEMGNAYLTARKYSDAVAQYRDALMHGDWWCDAENGPCQVSGPNAGMEEALLLSGQFDSAIEHVDARIKDSPKFPEPYSQRCRLRAIAGKDLDSALADCSEALKIDPHYANALASRGFVNFKLNNLAEAQADFDAALDRDSHLAGAWYMRGVIKLRNGNTDAGNDDIASAKKRDPAIAERFADYGVKP